MTEHTPPSLSELVGASEGSPSELLHTPTDRRTFLSRAAVLSFAIPGVGAALSGCAPAGSDKPASATPPAGSAAAAGGQGTAPRVHNSDSRLDSAVLKGRAHGNTSATPGPPQGAPAATYHRFDPAAAAAPAAGGVVQLHWHAREAPVRISDGHRRRGVDLRGRHPRPDRALPRRRHGRVHAHQRRRHPALDGLPRGADRSEDGVPLRGEGPVGDLHASSRSTPAPSCTTAAPRRC